MYKRESWKKYFSASLGIHGVIVLLIIFVDFHFPLDKIVPASALSVEFVNTKENGQEGDGGADVGSGFSENVVPISAPQTSKSMSLQEKMFSMQEASSLVSEREFTQNDAAQVSQLTEKQSTTNRHATESVDRATGESSGTISKNGSGNDGTGGTGSNSGEGIFDGGGFSANGDGTYTALSADGISYKIVRDEDAVYPDEARSIGYSRNVSVQAKLLVGLDGGVEQVEILNSVPNLGFRESAIKALREMQFAPIYYKNHNIKMYFIKTIHFQPS